MAFDARAVANYFLERARAEGLPLDPMKLQKLVYIAHGWHLAVTGRELVAQPVQAWPYGPVIKLVYETFKRYRMRPIKQRARYHDAATNAEVVIRADFPDDTRAALDRVWEVYKPYTALQLSTLTHQAGTPWFEVAGKRPRAEIRDLLIPNELIRKHYVEKAAGTGTHA